MSYLSKGAATRQNAFVKTRNNAKKYSRTKLKNTKWGKTNVSINEVAVKCPEKIDFVTTEYTVRRLLKFDVRQRIDNILV